MRKGLAILLQWLLLSLCTLWISHLYAPLFYRLRQIENLVPMTVLVVLSLLWLRAWKRSDSLGEMSQERKIFALMLLGTGLWQGYQNWDFQRHENILSRVPPAQLRQVGAHLMVGFHNPEEVLPLIDSGAVGGVFITTRNVRGRSAKELQSLIQSLQMRRRERQLPPLWVAADQEGGGVSRLSPPLPQRPYLHQLIQETPPQERAQALYAHGLAMGRDMAALGFNLNFAPVVDLKPASEPKENVSTQISVRAIAADPQSVIAGAQPFIQGLQAAGVHATLKHFPGLARIQVDTHLQAGQIQASVAEMEASDWRPFRQLLDNDQTWLMLGHVLLKQVDAQQLSSTSKAVIQDLLRGKWGLNNVIITDDLCMGPTVAAGIGQSALRSLQAGGDMVLVAYDPRQAKRVIHALVQGLQTGALSSAMLKQSRQRLERASLLQPVSP